MSLTTVKMQTRPTCDICGKPAEYDGRTIQGPWAYMCESCFNTHGVGLGTGIGQKIIVPGEQS